MGDVDDHAGYSLISGRPDRTLAATWVIELLADDHAEAWPYHMMTMTLLAAAPLTAQRTQIEPLHPQEIRGSNLHGVANDGGGDWLLPHMCDRRGPGALTC